MLLAALGFGADRVAFLRHAHAIRGTVTGTATAQRACDDGSRVRRRPGLFELTPNGKACTAYYANFDTPSGEHDTLLLHIGTAPPAGYSTLVAGEPLEVLIEPGTPPRVVRDDGWSLWSLPATLGVVALSVLALWRAFSRPPME